MIPKEVSPGPWACPAGDLKVRPIGLTFPYGSASLGPVISLQFLTGLHDIVLDNGPRDISMYYDKDSRENYHIQLVTITFKILKI